MRFSSLFQLSAVPQQPAGGAEPHRQRPAMEAIPSELPELPEDLDARVRLVGEWQLGEAAS